jgi:hypothetical protein
MGKLLFWGAVGFLVWKIGGRRLFALWLTPGVPPPGPLG